MLFNKGSMDTSTLIPESDNACGQDDEEVLCPLRHWVTAIDVSCYSCAKLWFGLQMEYCVNFGLPQYSETKRIKRCEL